MSIIVGSAADPHVQAVIAAMSSAPSVIDAASILDSAVTISTETLEILGVRVLPGNGWLRRLAPEGWIEATQKSDLESVSRSAAVSALAAIARDSRFTWLTRLDHLGSAENKPHQYRQAEAAGVPVPEWIVTTDPAAVPQSGHWISKALGPGSFIDARGVGRVVPTRLVDISDVETIARVPFILQRFVAAKTHARVVTVGERVWSATLPAESLPVDWRMSAAGHYGFTPDPAPDGVHELAATVSSVMEVGYSAQDWIQDIDGDWWFVDLNPAGQWLFLPGDVASAVSSAIAGYLDGAR